MKVEKLQSVDPDVFEALKGEVNRQEQNLELIASENYVSEAVLEITGSVFTNKYAEGYPGRRYYGGCEFTDVVERLARERAKELFQADHANVQPHSGSQANMAAYFSVLEPGDKILGMDLSHGGHLTHGHPLSFSGRFFEVASYGVHRDTEQLDYQELMADALREKPKLIIAGASAYPRLLDFPKFREIADAVGAYLMVDMAHIAGLVATGEHPTPVPYADFVTTTTHKTLRGPRGGLVLCREEHKKALNRNVFPGIQGGPLVHIVAAKAVALKEAMTPEFKAYQHQVVINAKKLADVLGESGIRIVSGGTDNHLMLLDVTSIGLTGKTAELALDKAGITANKNTIPFDKNKPMIASGIRLGTPTVTTRGMKEAEMEKIGQLIADSLKHTEDDLFLTAVKEEVVKLTKQFPTPYKPIIGQ
ncbi:MAG: serine hydroxymethyltransferase [Acidobacteria bacterium]|nr:MAG: serine hydroxymethyltransferase [Acidobacteriota bacterium]RLE20755.1 MAG: serine hydroxymethyltransferase [Acidobacteriota bacterium]